MSSAVLSSGAVAQLKARTHDDRPYVLQVAELKAEANNKHSCILSDGPASIRAFFASQLKGLVADGKLTNGSRVKVMNYIVNSVSGNDVLMVTELEVLSGAAAEADAALGDHNVVPDVKTLPAKSPTASIPAIKMENCTPDVKPSGMKAPAFSPISFMTPPSQSPLAGTLTPSSLMPPMQTPPSQLAVSDRKTYHRIGALHPYESNWCIKAKVTRKGPLRSISIRGSDVAIFNVDLVDDSGAQIQGTFWRGSADRYSAALQEGRVYVFSRFKVKPADKKYSSVKADYQIDFMDNTEVSEAADQEAASSMTAAVEITPIEALPRRLGARAPVDVMGVVLALGQLGTVKRKADATELPRRDVTIGDTSLKSVVITLWGDNATGTASLLDGQEGRAVIQVTNVRITDFNGCSLSSLSKSVVSVDPPGADADALRTWYATAELTADRFTPVGQDLAGSRVPGSAAGGVPTRERYYTLRELSGLSGDSEGLAGDKAVFHGLTAAVVKVNEEGQMYYLANPENGKKVVDQGDGRYTEADGRVVERAEHRYVLSVKLADHTGTVNVQLFNKEAELLVGMKADDLAALKDRSTDDFNAALRAAQWRSWSVVAMSKAREYNGERKVRHTAHRVDAMDWVAEGQRLINIIAKYH